MKLINLVFLTLCLVFCSQVKSETLLALNEDSDKALEISSWLYYAFSTDNQDIEQVKNFSSTRWERFPQNNYNHIDVDPFWVKFNLYNAGPNVIDKLISLGNPHIDKLDIYHFVQGKLVNHTQMGDSLPFAQRLVINNLFIYPFKLEPEVLHTFYIKIDSEGSANLPLSLWSPTAFVQYTETHSLSTGFQLGALTAIGFFCLCIAIISRSFSYSYYAGYVLSVTLLVATLQGVAFRFLWPNWPIFQPLMITLLIPLGMFFALLFTEKVLQLKYHSLPLLRLCRYSASFALLLLFITPLLKYSQALYINIIAVLFVTALLMFIACLLAVRGHKLAKLYTLAWSGMLLGSFVTGSLYLGLFSLPIANLTPLMIGLTFEIIFMASILAIRYNDERKSKLKTQKEALLQSQRIHKTKEEALLIEANSNEKLEQMVQERTLELEIALRELNEANQKLTEQTTTDSLTGVKNRAAFDKRLQAEGKLSRRQQTPMAILMIDIDHFKSINDSYGHLAGDQTLRLIAQTLKEKLKRPADLVSRFGGEEFAIILPNTDELGAERVAELIRKTIDNLPIIWENIDIPLTISIGVSSEIIQSEVQPTRLLEQADKALYRAKNDGRNRVMVYTPGPQKEINNTQS
ncbi:sensor domain-containing diguanylate cyclase [Shewanella sp. D64]|uniref:sensor domain-containing diguanylate cyclase n=1 Tax=unclassified Shewanella TaxID=196818 RepID=UPI0022BA462F|nr:MULTISPECIES: diguanylate cyclase [unclassified Shewanella]MEC4726148.1 sensor domain-containing diguanylate cyclase [Shewanella sp. D64]MEC4737936.1 sensor domain-containing diguanylate cyclase [Shewanella sp. E94]WBJ96137.1 sensor domain-containing diguanylate cyclase [Shewanella sp. MTB7]